MAGKFEREDRHDVVEFLKEKNCTEWSNSSASKLTEYTVNPLTKLKTLPQAQGTEINKVIDDIKAALPYISPKEVRRFLLSYIRNVEIEIIRTCLQMYY